MKKTFSLVLAGGFAVICLLNSAQANQSSYDLLLASECFVCLKNTQTNRTEQERKTLEMFRKCDKKNVVVKWNDYIKAYSEYRVNHSKMLDKLIRILGENLGKDILMDENLIDLKLNYENFKLAESETKRDKAFFNFQDALQSCCEIIYHAKGLEKEKEDCRYSEYSSKKLNNM